MCLFLLYSKGFSYTCIYILFKILFSIMVYYRIFFLAELGLPCGSWAAVAAAPRLSCTVTCGMLVPRSGIEPMVPTLEGGFLTTGLPEKFLS